MKEYNADWATASAMATTPQSTRRRWPRRAGKPARLEECQRHRPVHAHGLCRRELAHLTRNPNYWDKEKIDGTEYKLPFVDKVVYRIIKDESTRVTAFRTGKLDILEAVRWQNFDDAEEEQPQIQWQRDSRCGGSMLVLRVDKKPFDDIRVRRALNMAVNKEEIIKTYYNGNAEIFAYPEHPEYVGYYEPLESMPDESRSSSPTIRTRRRSCWPRPVIPTASPSRSRLPCSPEHIDLLPLVAGYLEQVGVKIEIQPMEYAAFFSAMTTRPTRRLFHE